jgi:hypothetical protein
MSLTRILASWLAICVAMVINGGTRELALVPSMGRTSADIMSAVLGTAIILIATRFLFRPLAGRPTAELARVSAIFVVLTVAFEFSFGHWVDHKSWAELLANYEVWNGRLWPALLVILALTPFLWGRWMPRAPGASHAR